MATPSPSSNSWQDVKIQLLLLIQFKVVDRMLKSSCCSFIKFKVADRTLKSNCCSFIEFKVVDGTLKSSCCSFTESKVVDRSLKSNCCPPSLSSNGWQDIKIQLLLLHQVQCGWQGFKVQLLFFHQVQCGWQDVKIQLPADYLVEVKLKSHATDLHQKTKTTNVSFPLVSAAGAQLLYLMTVLNFAGRALARFNFSSQIFTFWDWNVPSCFQWPILKMVSMIACKLWHDPLVPAIIYHYK